MNASIQRFSFTNLLGSAEVYEPVQSQSHTNLLGSEQVPLYPILFVIGMVFGFLL